MNSLKARLIVQVLALLLPLIAVLACQSLWVLHRTERLELTRQLESVAERTYREWRIFFDGVDSGRIDRATLVAFARAREALRELAVRDAELDIDAVSIDLGKVESALEVDPSLESAPAVRNRLRAIDRVLRGHVEQYSKTVYVVLDAALETAHSQLGFVLVAALLTLAGAAFLLHRLIRGLTEPLGQAVQTAQRIARGDLVAAPAPPAGNDLDGLLRSLASMERSLFEYRTQVEQRSSELRALTQQAQELAQQAQTASRAKSQFLANMSHEIRTPMNGVLGMTELLLATELQAHQRRYTETVYRSGEALLQIINDILDFSKIEAGKFDIENIDFDARNVFEDSVALLAPGAKSKGLVLTCSVGADVPPVIVGDPGRLRQIVTNLVGNAIKFTQRGEVEMRVECRRGAAGEASAPERLHVLVRDTGIGMDATTLAGLFQPFTQANGSMARRYGGTGLGLVITRQLIELMGGAIAVHSEPGVGSRFEFDLPLRVGSALAVRMVPADPRGLRGRIALVVDDNPTNAAVLEAHLQSWGMRVEIARNGALALARLHALHERGERAAVALVDMKMPVMDGVAFVEALRGEPHLAPRHLVMLTSIAETQEVRRARAAGVAITLSKPVRQRELLQAIAQVAGTSGGAAAPAQAVAGARVLVVEDNIVNQEVVRAMLERLDCAVTLADSGVSGLRAMCELEFDLVFMDCQMPEMDGFEAVARFRHGPSGKYPFINPSWLPIVALTANALVGDAEHCLASGFDDYVSKPFTQRQLEAMLQRWVAAAGALDAGAMSPAEPRNSQRDALDTQRSGLDEVLERRTFEELRQLDSARGAGGLAELWRLHGAAAADRIEALRRAVVAGDARAAIAAVDALQADSDALGAQALSRLCSTVRSLANDRSFAEAQSHIAKLESEHQRVRDAIAALQRSTSDAAE